jgi:hypothetical protein
MGKKGLFSVIFNFWKHFWFPSPVTRTTTTDTTTTKEGSGPRKKAVCIAINDYPGTGNDLRGCVNDARNWKSFLESYRHFKVQAMFLNREATRAKVKAALEKLVKEAVAGDVLAITYSGHGTSVRDRSGDEADGRDEAWCLYDGTFTDDEIRAIISKLAPGVSLTVISDSCHSGTVTRAFMSAAHDGHDDYAKARYMPPEDDIDAFAVSALPVKKAIFQPRAQMKEVLLSGCKSTEYSYDARINGQNCGAFSYHSIQILKSNPAMTYAEFYQKLRKKLPSGRFPQTPQLEGSKENKESVMFE